LAVLQFLESVSHLSQFFSLSTLECRKYITIGSIVESVIGLTVTSFMLLVLLTTKTDNMEAFSADWV
jgi:hypothetical protein